MSADATTRAPVAPRGRTTRGVRRVDARRGGVELDGDDALGRALRRCARGALHVCAMDDDVAVAARGDGDGARETLAKTLGRFDASVASALVGKTYDGVVMDGTVTRACGVVVFDDDDDDDARWRDVVVTLIDYGGGDAVNARTRTRARSEGCYLVEAPTCEARPNASVVTWTLANDAAASLTLNENCDPDVRADLREALDRIVRETSVDEASKAAAKAMLVGGSLRAPVTRGRARLGTWQGFYLNEHRQGEHECEVLTVCDDREAMAQKTIEVSAGKRGLRDITDDVVAAIRDAHVRGTIGTLHCFCEHTSASLVIGPSDPSFATRFEDALNTLVPESWNDEFFRHTAEGRDDMPGHVKSTIVGAYKTVPIDADGTLSPLNGQRLYLCEHRNVGGFNSGLIRRVTLTLQCG